MKKRGTKKWNSRFQMDNQSKLMPISKRSQSQIITTILLILIGVIAAGIIMSFIIPFIKDKLQGGDCLDVVNKIEISSGYTCYNTTDDLNYTHVQVHIGEIKDLISGFAIELGGPSSKTFRITNDSHSSIEMYGGGEFDLPGDNEERTYVITQSRDKPESISVYSILKNGKACPSSDSIVDIEVC